MATISGKRFQITDGAATPTNLFPYTVTEAVYGLSTVLANTQSAAVTAAATSAASLYVPLTGGTITGALNIQDNSLNFVSYAAGSVIHRFANSSNHQPSWFDGTNWKTIAYAADLNSYLPLTAGSSSPLTGNLYINVSGSPAINFKVSGTSKVELGYNTTSGAYLYNYPSGRQIGVKDDGTPYYYDGSFRTLYHSGNSNKSDVAWSASSLTLANNNALYFKDSGGTARKLFDFNASNSLVIGRELNSVSSGDGELYVRSCGMYFQTTTVGGSWATRMTINSSGNVTIGASDLASTSYKLYVAGSFGVDMPGANDFIIKRTYSGGGAYITYYADNQTTNYWLAGADPSASYNSQFTFMWNSTRVATISTAGVLTTTGNITSGGSIALNGTSGGGTYGISLYGGVAYFKSFGIWMGSTSVGGTHGSVTGNWAAYFTMAGDANRGWIFRKDDTTNVASISSGGTLTTSGDQVVSSDATLKTNLQDVTYGVKDIAGTRAVTFDWKDGRGKSAGSIAQDWKPLIPELVHGEDGSMTLAYGQIALVNTIIEAREIEVLKKRVAELESEVNRLRS